MGRARDLDRPFLRAVARLGADRGRHARLAAAGVSDREFHLRALIWVAVLLMLGDVTGIIWQWLREVVGRLWT